MTTSSPATMSSSGGEEQQRRHHRGHERQRSRRPYLIITNISKRQNVRNLLQIAFAYGVRTVYVAGQRGFEFDHDARDTDVPVALHHVLRTGRLNIMKFDKLEECAMYVRRSRRRDGGDAGTSTTFVDGESRDVDDGDDDAPTKIIGVEIDNSSINLEDEPFGSYSSSSSSSVAFMMGNEGSGMSARQMSICDGFVRVSQYGGGTASLNVSVAAGLVLHRFFHWSRGEGNVGR
jgi:tRNA G18 (ribose-2'-O)-methylase SpoU